MGARVRVSPLCAKSSSGMVEESGSSHSLARVQPSISRWGHAVTERTQPMFSILLVEDSDEDYMAFTRALRDTAVTVSLPRCTRGEEALDYLYRRGNHERRANGNPAVMLLDLKLPKVNGFEVLEQVRADENLKLIPVVILTSSHEERDLVKGYKLGVNAYVVKPVDFHQFVNAIKEVGVFWAVINEPPPGSIKKVT